jgi:hypothetical protein
MPDTHPERDRRGRAFLCLVVLLAAVFLTPDAGAQSELPGCLLGHWMHAHEEDSVGVRVYRPADDDFPPARGRTGFALLASGELVYYGIAPADGPMTTPGTWAFIPPDQLLLAVDGDPATPVTLTVVSCSADRLEVMP